MFTGIDILVILVAVLLVFYLAGPDTKELNLGADPLVVMVVLVTIVLFVVSI